MILQLVTIPQTLNKAESLIDIILKGGWILAPIAILSIIAIFFIVERYTVVISALVNIDEFISNVNKKIREGKTNEALKLCQQSDKPSARVIEAGLFKMGKPIADIDNAMSDEAKHQMYLLEKGTGYIGITSAIAPMFGFLGTIFGVIQIFYNISLADNISIGIIAGGLYQKMVSSAAGLTVGIVAYAGFYHINTLIDAAANKMERNCNKVLDTMKDVVSS